MGKAESLAHAKWPTKRGLREALGGGGADATGGAGGAGGSGAGGAGAGGAAGGGAAEMTKVAVQFDGKTRGVVKNIQASLL